MNIKPVIYHFATVILCWVVTNVSAQNMVCPNNLDFENGNLNNWELYTGTCCPANTPNLSGPVLNRHDLMSGTGVDFYGGFPVVAPGGGSYSLKLGNNSTGAQAERARYYVRVPNNPNNIYTLIYRYAVVFQDPGHSAADQPRFEVNVFDSATGSPIPCNQFQFVASGTLPGFQLSTAVSPSQRVMYKPWSTASIDLSPMAGRTVAVDFTAGDCALGGHFGYAYLDIACNMFQSYTLYCPHTTTHTLEAPPGFFSYEWRDGSLTNVLGTTQNLTIPVPLSTATYAVILSPYSGYGCPDTLYTTFNISDMVVDVTLDTAVCAGESVQLSSGTNSTYGPYTYYWTPAAGLSCTTCDSPIASPNVTTKYYITITDKDGCTARDSVIVRVDERVQAEIVVDDTVCSHVQVPIKNNPTNPLGADYLWRLNEDNGTITSGIATPAITGVWQQPGLKKIQLAVYNGRCNAVDSDYIFVERSPQADFEIFKNECVGVPVQLFPVKDEEDAAYIWTIDEQNITDTNYRELYNLKWNTIGRKNILLTLRSTNGCSTSKASYIGIHPYPVVDLQPVNAANLCKGKPFELQTIDSYRYDYGWRPAQYFTTNGSYRVTGVAEQTGYVYVDVTNQFDCKTTDSFFVDAGECCEIFAPDAFTPDNDGFNDTYWSPDLHKHTLVQFMIANRRGQIVFDTKSATGGWDGTHDGKPAATDTYNYIIKYLCGNDGEETIKKGSFILLR